MVRPLALVIQRYGAEVVGGSETLAREYAERLPGRGFEVTVYTTTARDYVTWRSEYPVGESVEGGVRVRRFKPDRERDLQAFNDLAEPMYARRATEQDERAFLEAQGPFVPGLIDGLRENLDRYEAVLFFTYLYYSSFDFTCNHCATAFDREYVFNWHKKWLCDITYRNWNVII